MSIKKTSYHTVIMAIATTTIFIVGCGDSKKEASQAQLQMSETEAEALQTAASAAITSPTAAPAELVAMKAELESQGTVCAIGEGESADEMIARSMSMDAALAAIAGAAGQITETREIDADGNEIVRRTETVDAHGVVAHKSVTTYDKESGKFKVYVLAKVNAVSAKL